MNILIILLQCYWTGENKYLTATGNEECKSSYLFEVGALIGGFPSFREVYSVEEGKCRALLVDFVKSYWGIPEQLGDFHWGILGLLTGSFAPSGIGRQKIPLCCMLEI